MYVCPKSGFTEIICLIIKQQINFQKIPNTKQNKSNFQIDISENAPNNKNAQNKNILNVSSGYE